MTAVGEGTQQPIPEAIKERQRREAEKKQKKEELLALTGYLTGSQTATTTQGKAIDSGVLAIEDERHPEPPPEDQFTVGRPYAAALDM